VQRRATIGFSVVTLAAGIVMVVETAVLGGGIGFFIGALLIAAGGGRLYVSRKD
jgi:hypothetical protein